MNFASTLRVGQCKKKIDVMNDAFKYAMKMNDLGFIYYVENEILFYEILNGEWLLFIFVNIELLHNW